MSMMSPGASVGTGTCSTWALNGSRLIGPSITQGASTRSGRGAAMEVSVVWPCGTRASSHRPRRPHPRSGAMVAVIRASSMKTSRRGSVLP